MGEEKTVSKPRTGGVQSFKPGQLPHEPFGQACALPGFRQVCRAFALVFSSGVIQSPLLLLLPYPGPCLRIADGCPDGPFLSVLSARPSAPSAGHRNQQATATSRPPQRVFTVDGSRS